MDEQNKKLRADGRNDILAGIFFCVFAAWYFISATQIEIPNSLSSSFLNAASVPELWGGVLFILGIVVIIRGALKLAKVPKEEKTSDEKASAGQWLSKSSAAIAMFVVLFIYIFLMNKIGFMIDTVLFLFCEFIILTRKEERNYVVTAILALVFGVGIYMLFKYGFSMPLPQGFFKVF